MPALPQKVQRFVVLQLARYDRPTEVQKAVLEHFGIEVGLPQLGHYDPTTVKGQDNLGKAWKALFFEERGRVNQELDDIPLYHRGYRLRELQKLYNSPAAARNLKFRQEILVEAEKITGEVYTNRHKVEHSGRVDAGVMVSPAPVSAEEWSGLAETQQQELAKHRGNGAGANGQVPAAKKSGRRFTLNGDGG